MWYVCYVAAVVKYCAFLALECLSMLYACVRDVMFLYILCLYCEAWNCR